MRPALGHDRWRFHFLEPAVRHRRRTPLLEHPGRLRPNHRAWAHRAMQSRMPDSKSEVEEKAETQMSVEYLYEKKSNDDEYNEIWKALEREQSAFERILVSENKAFVMGRLFEAKYLTQKLRKEKDQQLNLVNEPLERQEKAEQVNAEEDENAWAA
jgi:hypothetical protein